jgi:hypothetical protein
MLHTVAIDGFTSLPIIITQQDASRPLKEIMFLHIFHICYFSLDFIKC